MDLVAVGIGNTSIQVALFHATKDFPIPAWHVVKSSAELGVDPFAECRLSSSLTKVAIASVNREGLERVRYWLERRLPEVSVCQLSNADFPVVLGQQAPELVGTDRVAAATATNALRTPGRCAVFVDAGTALTVNALDAQGKFLGGAILPGIGVSLSTLSQHTDQLPELDFAELIDAAKATSIGRSTKAAIRSGVFWGAIGAIRELTSRMAGEMECAPELYITGGFGQPLADALGEDAQFVPHLVLAGIALAVRGCD